MDPLWTFAPVDLDTVVEAANLQTRVDAKYLLEPHEYGRFLRRLSAMGGWSCLEIDGRRRFNYESVYFDTPDLATYRQHRQGRRRRFKVRTRTYADSGDCTFEVKLKGSRADTVKERLPYTAADAGRINPEAAEFLARALWEAYGMTVPVGLAPRVRTDYRRHTLVHLDEGTRVTCDEELRCIDMNGNAAGRTAAARRLCLVEVKAARSGGPVDRLLWELGARPESISKYCLAAAALRPGLRANPWSRALQRCFGTAGSGPAGSPPVGPASVGPAPVNSASVSPAPVGSPRFGPVPVSPAAAQRPPGGPVPAG